MKYLLMFASNAETDARSEAEEAAVMARIGPWWEEHAAAGRIVGGLQLQGPETATTVRHDAGGITIVDGPFVESKEQIGGYAVVEVADLDEAIGLARSWPWGGVVEVRPEIGM